MDASSLLLVITYLFWELAVSAVCLAGLMRIRPLAIKLSLLIGLNVTVSALCAMLLSFLRLNSPAAYLALAGVFCAVGVLLVWKRRDELSARFSHTLPSEAQPGYWVQGAALGLALGALLALSIRPIDEGDSLYNLHFVMGWVQNRTTPYEFAVNYVPFWELSFVPGLVLTHSDLFFWFNSLKPVLLLALALLLIARELDLPDRISVWTIPALLLFPHLWMGPSGVSTIKTDMISAAGYALAALVVVRAARSRSGAVDVALTALAAVFVSVKFSGPAAMLAGAIVAAVIAGRWVLRNLGKTALALAAVGGFWFVAAGHYYAHNFFAYGNPVFPFSINLGPIRLPGRGDLSGTSILFSLRDARLWRYFFLPERWLSPAGVFFPVILAAILIGSTVVAGIAAWRRRVTALASLALFELVSWFVYLRSFYSASSWPGDLAFVRNDLNSLRYVEGPLLVGELCLIWAFYRLGVSRILIVAVLAAQAASSFAILLPRAPDKPWPLMLLCGLGLALSSLALRRRILIPVAIVTVAASLLAGAGLTERRRPLWLPELQPLYKPLYEAQPQRLFYLIDEEYSQQPVGHFAMLGHRLQHDADSGSRRELAARTPPPHFVAWTRIAPDNPPVSLPGYTAVVSVPKGILFERR